MQTVDVILAAAALLSPGDLGRLRQAIERLARCVHVIELHPRGGLTFRLYRQDDTEFYGCLRRSLAIDEDYGYYLERYLWGQSERELKFAQVYLTLIHLTGESSRCLDEYKQGSSFPFLLDVIRQGRTFAYLLTVHNIRDSLYSPSAKWLNRTTSG